ncbi:MAG: sugar transferase [Planctomycetales bacterium]|nr:sugar transferase [Planctomycetales bacterium]
MAIAVLAPVMLFVWVVLTMATRGRALVRQTHCGEGGRLYQAVKFRTETSADGRGYGSRVTWLGSLLRLTSLDQTPQLWNVLKGDMSLVGPRSRCVDNREPAEHTELRPREPASLSSKPGLICDRDSGGARQTSSFFSPIKAERFDVRLEPGAGTLTATCASPWSLPFLWTIRRQADLRSSNKSSRFQ